MKDTIYEADIADEALIKRRLIGLSLDCPMEHPCEECPLNEVRNTKTVEERIKEVNDLPHIERVKIYQYHRSCLKSRESE